MAIKSGVLGTPDFGITEKLGLGKKVSDAAFSAFYNAPNKSTGKVLGSSTTSSANNSTPYGPQPAPAGYYPQNNTSYSVSSGGSSNSNNDSGDGGVSRQTRDLQNSISSGWDNYIRGLDDQLGGLNTQRGAQEGIVNSQYNQGVNTLGLQLQQGQQALGQDRADVQQNQVSNLRDISSNIRNAFQAGNVYLGARGAGDSSAANQYSYALNKMGTQQRSDVMQNSARILADVDARESNLKETYNSAINDLSFKKDEQIQQVSMWFAEAQQQIKNMKLQGGQMKSEALASLSKDLLNNAIQKVNQIEAEASNRRQMLDQWATGQSQDIEQLRGNLQGISELSYQMPTYLNAQTAPQYDQSNNMAMNFGGGGSMASRDDERLFSNFG